MKFSSLVFSDYICEYDWKVNTGNIDALRIVQ